MWMEWQRSDISNAFFPLFQMLVRGLPSTPEKIDRNVQDCARIFGQLNNQLEGRQYISGDSLGTADIVIGAMMFRYMTMPINRPSLQALEAWYQRLTRRPAYQKHVMIEYGRNVEEWAMHEKANEGIQ
jgi:glutathione S-transferase